MGHKLFVSTMKAQIEIDLSDALSTTELTELLELANRRGGKLNPVVTTALRRELEAERAKSAKPTTAGAAATAA